jgi:hypothetical protein
MKLATGSLEQQTPPTEKETAFDKGGVAFGRGRTTLSDWKRTSPEN